MQKPKPIPLALWLFGVLLVVALGLLVLDTSDSGAPENGENGQEETTPLNRSPFGQEAGPYR
jgi:hypothetical protein